MGHFCGVVDWRGLPPEGPANRREALRALARRGGEIVEYRDQHAWIACLDFGHFPGAGLELSKEGEVSVLAGQPLLGRGPSDRATVFAAMGDGAGQILAESRGQFAAALWSAASRTLRLCADALAIRPIYVRVQWRRVQFATSMRVLRALAGVDLRIDDRGFADIIHFHFPLGVRTVYEGVRLVGPAELLEFQSAGQRTLAYLDWAQCDESTLDRDTALDALHASFAQALRLRAAGAPAEASLSGGMDSRAVVAGLVDTGERPRTWCLAYPDSADEALARLAADALGVEHHSLRYSPAERLRTAYIPLAQQLRAHWTMTGLHPSDRPIRLWTGHGGSVGLGHVYMDAATVAAAGGAPSHALALRLFPRLGKWRTRLISRKRLRQLRTLAYENVLDELARCGTARPDRRLWLFYMLNDQCRHLHRQSEDIDVTGVELLAPMLDTAFLRLIAGLPAAWCLQHALYNRWIARFRAPATAVAWQSYPGHQPSPAAMPAGLRLQWDNNWHKSRHARRAIDRAAGFVLARADPRLAEWIEPWRARLARLTIRLGSRQRLHDLQLLRLLHRAVTGEDAFEEPARDQWVEPRIITVHPAQAPVAGMSHESGSVRG